MGITVLLVATCVVVGIHIALVLRTAFWMIRSQRNQEGDTHDSLPRIALIVAARNEEKDLPACLDALRAQKYPIGQLDIFVADDHSSDGTRSIIQTYVEQSECSGHRVHYVEVPDQQGHLVGKANALHAAIEVSDHDYILITDADCRPGPHWAATHARYSANPDIGIVSGHAYISGNSLFASLQALDWTYLLSTASMFAEMGKPITAMGNNMGIKHAAYEAIGGYPALPFSVTEDYVLFRAVSEQANFVVRYPVDPELSLLTLPVESFRQMFSQRRRWARGGLAAPLWVRALYLNTFLAYLLPLIGLVLFPFTAVLVLSARLLADFAMLFISLRAGNRRHRLLAFLPFEISMHAYSLALPFVLLLSPGIDWKGRAFGG